MLLNEATMIIKSLKTLWSSHGPPSEVLLNNANSFRSPPANHGVKMDIDLVAVKNPSGIF